MTPSFTPKKKEKRHITHTRAWLYPYICVLYPSKLKSIPHRLSEAAEKEERKEQRMKTRLKISSTFL